ncbi:MAG: sulfur carrier protein ThiS [Pyrinomonadaceae bacterium]
MRVVVNGESQEITEGATLDELISKLVLSPDRVAVELNLEVVRRGEWARMTLNEGDRVEIVHFVGGGQA